MSLAAKILKTSKLPTFQVRGESDRQNQNNIFICHVCHTHFFCVYLSHVQCHVLYPSHVHVICCHLYRYVERVMRKSVL